MRLWHSLPRASMKAESAKARSKSARRGIRREAGEGERVFEGLGVSPGIAIGPAHLHEAGNVSVPELTIEVAEVEPERLRFRAAVDKSLRQLSKLNAKTST